MDRTWDEHLQWCKDRALAHVAKGDLMEAVLSMASDIQKHEDTKIAQERLEMLVLAARFNWHPRGIRRWINGFN